MFGNLVVSALMTKAASSIDNVVWVTKANFSGFFTVNFTTSSGVSTKYIPTSACPIVPSTSG